MIFFSIKCCLNTLNTLQSCTTSQSVNCVFGGEEDLNGNCESKRSNLLKMNKVCECYKSFRFLS